MYCAGNPVSYVDPSGHSWSEIAIAVVAIVAVVALTIVTFGGGAALLAVAIGIIAGGVMGGLAAPQKGATRRTSSPAPWSAPPSAGGPPSADNPAGAPPPAQPPPGGGAPPGPLVEPERVTELGGAGQVGGGLVSKGAGAAGTWVGKTLLTTEATRIAVQVLVVDGRVHEREEPFDVRCGCPGVRVEHEPKEIGPDDPALRGSSTPCSWRTQAVKLAAPDVGCGPRRRNRLSPFSAG